MIDRTIHNYTLVVVILDKTIGEACLIDVAIPNSHNLHSTVIEKLQKYTYLKEELIRIWQLKMVLYNITSAVLPTTGIIPNKLHESLKLLNLHPAVYILLLEAVILNTDHIVRKVFGRTVNKRCLVSEPFSLLKTSYTVVK
jgi:hypothetical protein